MKLLSARYRRTSPGQRPIRLQRLPPAFFETRKSLKNYTEDQEIQMRGFS
jgi:hypothetical protein